jgi:hypothetical protein
MPYGVGRGNCVYAQNVGNQKVEDFRQQKSCQREVFVNERALTAYLKKTWQCLCLSKTFCIFAP